MKEKYDLIFSLGSFPLVSKLLKDKELQIYDFPFDKIIGGDLFTRLSLLMLDCNNFIEQKNIIKQENIPVEGAVQYKDSKTGFIYNSDFDNNIPVENNYPLVKLRYDKYIRNLNVCIKAAKKILIIYIENPQIKEDDVDNEELIIEALQKLTMKYPNKNFKFLYIKNDENSKEIKVTPINNNSQKIIMNFYKQFSEMSSHEIDMNILSIILSNIQLNKSFKQLKMIYLQRLIKLIGSFN